MRLGCPDSERLKATGSPLAFPLEHWEGAPQGAWQTCAPSHPIAVLRNASHGLAEAQFRVCSRKIQKLPPTPTSGSGDSPKPTSAASCCGPYPTLSGVDIIRSSTCGKQSEANKTHQLVSEQPPCLQETHPTPRCYSVSTALLSGSVSWARVVPTELPPCFCIGHFHISFS